MPTDTSGTAKVYGYETYLFASTTTSLKDIPELTAQANPNAQVGGSFPVRAYGFARTSPLSFKVGTVPVTTVLESDGVGRINRGNTYALTIPGGLTPGTYPLTATDATGNSASFTLTIYAPTLTLVTTSVVSNASFHISGTGWVPGHGVSFYYEGQDFCYTYPSSTGSFTQRCSMPTDTSGTAKVYGYETYLFASTTTSLKDIPELTAQGGPHVKAGSRYLVRGYGYARTSPVSFKLGSTELKTIVETDGAGRINRGNTYAIIVPSYLAAGKYSVVGTDGSGMTASFTVTVTT
jgi:hypothetical protein